MRRGARRTRLRQPLPSVQEVTRLKVGATSGLQETVLHGAVERAVGNEVMHMLRARRRGDPRGCVGGFSVPTRWWELEVIDRAGRALALRMSLDRWPPVNAGVKMHRRPE
jgi:hypothetical protein